jgi:nicotinamide-nucleotide amidase
MANSSSATDSSKIVNSIIEARQKNKDASSNLKIFAKPEVMNFQIILSKIDYESKAIAAELLILLNTIEFNIITIESLTAGKIVSTLADIPSYANCIYGGFVVYDSDAKREFIDVTVKSVYNQKCAKQMAEGALNKSRAMCALAVTGQAGGYDATDNIYLGYVDTAFSYRNLDSSGNIVYKTLTKRIKFCNDNYISSSCDEYKTRLKVFQDKKCPELSNFGQPLSDDLYQIRQIIRTACVRDALLFAYQTIKAQNIDKTITDNLQGKIFDIKTRDEKLASCGEPSKFIKKYMKGNLSEYKVQWPNLFGSTTDNDTSGSDKDEVYNDFCNQEDWNEQKESDVHTLSVPTIITPDSGYSTNSGGSRIKNKNTKLKKTKKYIK